MEFLVVSDACSLEHRGIEGPTAGLCLLVYPGFWSFVKQSQKQSHYIEVVQGAIFMEQNMRFVLILDRLPILKKKVLDRL